jgi:single-stranded-DNA-specific exonuclease
VAAVTQEQRKGLLGVETSLRGRRWEMRGGDERLALALSQRLGLPEILGRVLAGRGVGLEEAEGFLNPTLRDLLPDPSSLKDSQRAAERIAQALAEGETIAVFGDYDVDGATSSALLLRYFRALGVEAIAYIPDRMNEGYGPNAPALRSLRQRGAKLAITVDCGITSFEALEAAAEVGLEVIVVDHHKAEPALPKAVAVVNPNRLDDESGQGQLAAVGVTFLLLVALNRHLRNEGYFTGERSEPDLRSWLDLVALGTVCDVVPLTGVNRGFVTQGLKVLAQRRNCGLLALGDVARVDEKPGTYHLGFLLGPRVNAGGRVGQADLGVRLLATEDPGEARALAEQLDGYNRERREIEATVLDEAIAQVEAGPAPEGLVFAAAPGWHPGVIGIVASRLKDRYDLPALVVALDEEGIGKGSGRSVRGVDLGSGVIAARQAGLLINGGGHAMAAGLTVSGETLEELRGFLASRLSRQLEEIGYQPAMGFDGLLQPGAATSELLGLLDRVGPFGTANPEPRFVLPGVKVVQAQVVGESHVRCRLVGADGAGLKAIAFKALDSALGEKMLAGGGRAFHVAGKLRADNWAGRDAVQFLIDDAAEA